jgi:biopolymer transport protein ExbD
MDKTAMAAHFTSMLANNAQPEMHLRADRATRYDKVAEVLADAQRAGIVKIAFVTEPAR